MRLVDPFDCKLITELGPTFQHGPGFVSRSLSEGALAFRTLRVTLRICLTFSNLHTNSPIPLSMTGAEVSPNENESTDRNIEAGEEQPLLTSPPAPVHDDDTSGRNVIVTAFWKSGPALALG